MVVNVMRIDVEWLNDHEACEEQVELFIATFPDGCKLTVGNVRLALRAGLEIDWFAMHFLPAPALPAYRGSVSVAWRAYAAAVTLAWRTYEQAAVPAWCDYQGTMVASVAPWEVESICAALRAYQEATAAALLAHQEATAEALIRALGLD